MGSIRTSESISKLVKLTVSTLQLPASRLNIGAAQYVTSALTLNTAVSGVGGLDAAVAAGALYYVYAVVSSGTVYLIGSTNSSLPSGFTQARAVGGFTTNASSQIDQVGEYPGNLAVAGSFSAGGGISAPPIQNFIINGGFDFSQRIGSGNQTASLSYGLDRWYLRHDHTSVAISRQDVTGDLGLDGFYKYCARIANTTRGSGTYVRLWQPIETQHSLLLAGQMVTFSAYLRKSSGLSSGSVAMAITYHTGTDTTPATLWTAGNDVGTVVIPNSSLSTAFQRFYFTVFIPSTARTIAPFIQLAGTPTDGQYVEVTKVMLNIGTTAAPFQRAGGTIGGELALCQRYYEKSYDVDIVPGTASATAGFFYADTAYASTSAFAYSLKFSVTKRVPPTATYAWDSAGNGGSTPKCERGSNVNQAMAIDLLGTTGVRLRSTGTASASGFACGWAVDSEL